MSGPQAEAAPPAQVPALRAMPAADPGITRAKRWRWLSFLALGVLALAALGAVLAFRARPPLVGVEIAATGPVTRLLAVNGRIAAAMTVDVRPAVTGVLVALPVAEGDTVTQGQLLGQVDAQAQASAVRQAVAGLDAALVAQAQARQALDRAEALGDTVAQSVRDADAFALQAAAQEVLRREAALEEARIVLDRHSLRAPIAGAVIDLTAEQGQIVGPSLPFLTLATLEAPLVEAVVDEIYATQIALGQTALLQLAGQTKTYEGHVRFVSTSVDVATGGLAVKIAFDTPVTAPIGLTVATNIIVDQLEAALTVPRTALQRSEAGMGVFLAKDGVAQFQPIAVVDWPAARLVVTDGLTEGDVVIADADGLSAGQAVAVDLP